MKMSKTAMSSSEVAAADWLGSNQDFVLGAQFMAAMFDSLLAGVLLCQLTRWIPKAKYDNRVVQILVTIGSLAALCTTVYTWANYLTTFVYDFGSLERFASWNMLGIYPLLDGLTVVPVQLFFTERAVRINGNSLLILLICGSLIAVTFGAAISITVATRGQDMMNTTDVIKITTIVWPSVCTSAHVFITTSIVSGLLRTRAPHESSLKLINRVIAICLESQLPATIFAIAAMTAIASNPAGPMVPFIVIVHPKVFMVGCLAMVNLRHYWRMTGKIPSSYCSTNPGSALVSSAREGLSASSSGESLESAAPATPKAGLVRGFSGPRDQGIRESQIDYGFDIELGAGKALEGMKNLVIKQPGQF